MIDYSKINQNLPDDPNDPSDPRLYAERRQPIEKPEKPPTSIGIIEIDGQEYKLLNLHDKTVGITPTPPEKHSLMINSDKYPLVKFLESYKTYNGQPVSRVNGLTIDKARKACSQKKTNISFLR